jgi:Ca2+-binding EF-hand superfamily protein
MSPWKNPVGDVNMDGKVDGRDIAIVARAFGSIPGDPRWNALADVNDDGKIDGKDIVTVVKLFGKS